MPFNGSKVFLGCRIYIVRTRDWIQTVDSISKPKNFSELSLFSVKRNLYLRTQRRVNVHLAKVAKFEKHWSNYYFRRNTLPGFTSVSRDISPLSSDGKYNLSINDQTDCAVVGIWRVIN